MARRGRTARAARYWEVAAAKAKSRSWSAERVEAGSAVMSRYRSGCCRICRTATQRDSQTAFGR